MLVNNYSGARRAPSERLSGLRPGLNETGGALTTEAFRDWEEKYRRVDGEATFCKRRVTRRRSQMNGKNSQMLVANVKELNLRTLSILKCNFIILVIVISHVKLLTDNCPSTAVTSDRPRLWGHRKATGTYQYSQSRSVTTAEFSGSIGWL